MDMNSSTTEVQVEREALLSSIRAWEKELDELSAENGQVVLKAESSEDKKLVAHFENQFTIQKNRLDKMKHHVKISGGDAHTQADLQEFSTFLDKLRSEFVAFAESIN
jgi:hypothetical protein